MKLNPFRIVWVKTRLITGLVIGAALCFLFIGASYYMVEYTSTNEFCDICHVHPQAYQTWEDGLHYKTSSGVRTDCVACHLPPKDNLPKYLYAKGKTGFKDIYGFYFKDHDSFNWDLKSTLEYAPNHVYDESCIDCHQELFPTEITSKGLDAHIYYQKNTETLLCINCHLHVGHYSETPDEQILADTETEEENVVLAPLVTEIGDEFVDYTEVIPTSGVKFEMVALEGGTFLMGAGPDDDNAKDDERPTRQVELKPFWMGKFEVSWREFDSYYSETVTREKNEAGLMVEDAETGPTPPYGSPDQGWGKGSQPAITMRHYTAMKYCDWLSAVTGHKYRLPTEAEWEYAARAGSNEPYFFAPDSSQESWWSRLLGGKEISPELFDRYTVYQENSKYRTQAPRAKEPNPWGLYNMLGNVKEFCLDWYSPEILSQYPENQVILNPKGPDTGTERVIRGGSFRSPKEELRASARDFTRTEQWMRTDPQTPKSVWWYSDVTDVGFRIVRELDEGEE